MYILYIVMFISTMQGNINQPLAVSVNSQTFADEPACSTAANIFIHNVPNSTQNPFFIWCVKGDSTPVAPPQPPPPTCPIGWPFAVC